MDTSSRVAEIIDFHRARQAAAVVQIFADRVPPTRPAPREERRGLKLVRNPEDFRGTSDRVPPPALAQAWPLAPGA